VRLFSNLSNIPANGRGWAATGLEFRQISTSKYRRSALPWANASRKIKEISSYENQAVGVVG
jgi:hypothetical protein